MGKRGWRGRVHYPPNMTVIEYCELVKRVEEAPTIRLIFEKKTKTEKGKR